MDFSRYPLEKLFGFVAGVIPGFVALLIFQLAAPGSFNWFFSLKFPGDNSKLTLIIAAAFVIGNSLTTFLDTFLRAAGGAVGGVMAQTNYKPVPADKIAPWRNPQWRMALKAYLGAKAPNDTSLMSEKLVELRRSQIDLLPEGDRPAELARLALEKLNLEIDDGNWERWYRHYHALVLSDYGNREVHWWIGQGLNFNLETTAIYILVSACVVPSVRRWWIILPSCAWVLVLFLQSYSDVAAVLNDWSTLSRQIEYLMTQPAQENSARA